MNYKKILPFLDSKQINKLIEDTPTEKLQEMGISIASLLPFASTKTIDRLIIEEYKKTGVTKSLYFPFASERALHEIVVYYIENDCEELSDNILPFLSQNDVKLLFDYSLTHSKDIDKTFVPDEDDEDEDDEDEDEEDDDDGEDDEDDEDDED